MSSSISDKNQKLLCTKSGNRCAMPDCHRILTENTQNGDPELLIGIMAHIEGEKPDSARYNSNMTDTIRNSYENLILLCPSCHAKIDGQPLTYTKDSLHDIKSKHEEWVIKATAQEMPNITFMELEMVTNNLIGTHYINNGSLKLTPPEYKISKNGLSSEIKDMILMGMVRSKEVSDFIKEIDKINKKFKDRLITGFQNEYKRLKDEEGEVGDDIFYNLFDFSCNNSKDFKIRAAGLSILTYLFEICEVFEK